MKVLQISHHFLPHIGGIELYVYRLSRDLIKSNIDCRVITSSNSTNNPSKVMGIPTKHLPSITLLPRNPYIFGLKYELRKERPNIVHIHSIWFFPSLQACLLKKKYKFQIINTVHGVMPDQASFAVKFFLFLFKPIASYILKKSDKIIVLSEIERMKIKKFFPGVSEDKIFIIAPGIDAVRPDKKVVEKVKNKIKSDYLVFTGRIIQDKNPDVLIEAMKLVPEKKRLSLVFVGPIDEKYKNQLSKLSQEVKVIFWGPLNPIKSAGEIAALYKNAVASISIGSWEGLPVRVMESMAQNVPAIVYRSGGINDLIKNNKNGFIIESLSPKELATAIERYLSLTAKKKEEIAAVAKETVKSYLWTSKFKEMLRLYKK